MGPALRSHGNDPTTARLRQRALLTLTLLSLSTLFTLYPQNKNKSLLTHSGAAARLNARLKQTVTSHSLRQTEQ